MKNMNRFSQLAIIGIFLITVNSCKKEDHALLPEVTTYELINDSEFSATAKGTVISDGGASVTERGICWSTNQMPTINDEFTIEGNGLGDFTSTLSELVQGTTYYARAYATNRKGTVYGETFSFVAGTITDVEGNIYNMVTIGTQIWMQENLKTTKYNDGTSIMLGETNSQWMGTNPKYCWYNNDINKKQTVGALYKWYTINTGKLCPIGWHVPSSKEWETLVDYLGGFEIAGAKLKSTTGWINSVSGTGANNSSGFTALECGYRNNEGPEEFYMAWWGGSKFAYWWSSDVKDDNIAKGYWIYDGNAIVNEIFLKKSYGLSVRCIKD